MTVPFWIWYGYINLKSLRSTSCIIIMVKSSLTQLFSANFTSIIQIIRSARLHISESNNKRRPLTLGENLHTQRPSSAAEKEAERDTAFSHTHAPQATLSFQSQMSWRARGCWLAEQNYVHTLHRRNAKTHTACCGNVVGTFFFLYSRSAVAKQTRGWFWHPNNGVDVSDARSPAAPN